jgi:hypothetical protein
MARLQKKSRRQSPQVQPNIRHSPRDGFNAYIVISSVHRLFGHRSRQRACAQCAGHQHRGARTTRLHVRRPALVSRQPNVHRIPASRVVTIARYVPLLETGWGI